MGLTGKYVCVKQHDVSDCGAACLATVSRQHGLKYPISKIRKLAGTDKTGTNIYGIVQTAEKIGFTAKAVKATNEALLEDFPLPAIAHVLIDQSFLHYVVIHKITKNEIVIADPGKGIRKIHPKEFAEEWTGILILLTPTPDFTKRDETTSLFSRFFSLIKPQKGVIAQIFVASILYTLFGILGAFYFQFLIDDILSSSLEKTLHIISFGVICLYTFRVLLNGFRNYLLLHFGQKIDLGLILGYYHHVLSLPMDFFSSRRTGEIISRFMDASKVRNAISGATMTMMIDTLMVLIGGVILYMQNAFLFGVTIVLIPLYVILVITFRKPFETVNRNEMESNAKLTSYLVESLNGIEIIKANNAEGNTKIKNEQNFIKFLTNVFKHGMLNNYQSSFKSYLQLVGGIVILWVGAFQVIQGNLSIGQLITYNALLAYFLEPIQNLINLQPTLQSAVVAAERLNEIFDLEPEKTEDEDEKLTPTSLKGSISVKDVDFRYGSKELALKNIDLHINQGERIAFVGESGSGKTSFVKLLLRFYEYEKGDILINDWNIKDINISSLRQRIAYIPQTSFFFSGSIKENLTLGLDNNLDFEDVVKVAKVAQAHDFINKLPLRYNTILEENAGNLSGGQRQRLAIARALLKNPDILIMDEATSNLDSTTERAITETLESIETQVTTIIIAHRLSTIRKCDKILVFDNGEIIENGTHEELINTKGKYYNLWKDQMPEIYEDERPLQMV